MLQPSKNASKNNQDLQYTTTIGDSERKSFLEVYHNFLQKLKVVPHLSENQLI